MSQLTLAQKDAEIASLYKQNVMAQLPKKKNKDEEENNLDVNTGNGGPGQSSPLPIGQPVPYYYPMPYYMYPDNQLADPPAPDPVNEHCASTSKNNNQQEDDDILHTKIPEACTGVVQDYFWIFTKQRTLLQH